MSQTLASLSADEFIELAALLVSVSGILVLGASLIARGVDRISVVGDRLAMRQREPMLYAAFARQGVYYLAWGGVLLALAELVEFVA
jgi:hypothetical protein